LFIFSAEYSLEPMLRKWKLQWKQIPLSTFCCSQSLEYKHEIQMYEIRKRKERWLCHTVLYFFSLSSL